MADPTKDFPTFKVAFMKSPQDRYVSVYTVRCADIAALNEFLPRLLEVGDVDKLYFLEVMMHSGKEAALLRESPIPWPKGKIADHKAGVVAPKVMPSVPSVAEEVSNIIAKARLETSKLPALPAPVADPVRPSEYYRPINQLTIKVA